MKLALLSFWHVHAADYTQDAADHPNAEIVAVWDDDESRGRAGAERFGLAFEPDLASVLANPEIDGVIVTTATAAHVDVIPAAARASKHVFTEKVLAPTLREALDIVRVIEASGVTGWVVLNRLEQPWTRAAERLLADGVIGRVTSARVRVAHDGLLPGERGPHGWLPARFVDPAESAGGALIDLGAHPLYLTRRFLGMPRWVSAQASHVTGHEGDDNAVVIMQTERGGLGVAETGFVSRGRRFEFEISGTDGAIAFEDGNDSLDWIRPGIGHEHVPLPPGNPWPLHRWIDAIEDGDSTADNLTLGLELSAIVEAASQSIANGRRVDLTTLDGWSKLQARNGH